MRSPARRRSVLCLAAVASLASAGPAARALEEPAGEWDALKACEKRLCKMILGKEPKGNDLKCDLSKTWAKSSLKNGESKGVSWMFGDARCTVNLNLSRADVVGALTLPELTVRIPQHTVKCQVERGEELQNVTAKLAPKLKFKGGAADKVWINLKEVEGPDDIKGTLWVAAGLEDKLGVFHKPLVKSINKFMHEQCAKRYGPGAEAKEGGKDGAKKSGAKQAGEAGKTAPAAPQKATASAP
jgi:hypothetical protein